MNTLALRVHLPHVTPDMDGTPSSGMMMNFYKKNRFDSDWCTRQEQYKNRNIIIRKGKESRMYIEERDPTAKKTWPLPLPLPLSY
jgi:hypothetical protein